MDGMVRCYTTPITMGGGLEGARVRAPGPRIGVPVDPFLPFDVLRVAYDLNTLNNHYKDLKMKLDEINPPLPPDRPSDRPFVPSPPQR